MDDAVSQTQEFPLEKFVQKGFMNACIAKHFPEFQTAWGDERSRSRLFMDSNAEGPVAVLCEFGNMRRTPLLGPDQTAYEAIQFAYTIWLDRISDEPDASDPYKEAVDRLFKTVAEQVDDLPHHRVRVYPHIVFCPPSVWHEYGMPHFHIKVWLFVEKIAA